MNPIRLSAAQARRFLVRLHGLSGEHRFSGKEGVVDFVRQCGCIQFDPIDVCGRSPELTLFSRVKGFEKPMLYALLYEERRLIDYFDKQLAILPVEDWPFLARERAKHYGQGRSRSEVDAAAGAVFEMLNMRPCVCARDLNMQEKADWYWSASTLGRATLETLYFRGELCIHHKQGPMKFYAPTARHIPPELLSAGDPHPTEADYTDWQTLRRIGAVGLLWNRPSDAFLCVDGHRAGRRGDSFARLLTRGDILPVSVEGIPETLYARARDSALLAQVADGAEYAPRMECIAPLDNLIWDRKLIERLFGFSYTWEIYTPVSKRKYGYYVLPILRGETFVGRVEAAVDKKARALMIKGLWWEGRAYRGEARRCLMRLARFNGCAEVVGL